MNWPDYFGIAYGPVQDDGLLVSQTARNESGGDATAGVEARPIGILEQETRPSTLPGSGTPGRREWSGDCSIIAA